MSRTQATSNLKQRFGQALKDDFLRQAVKFTADSLRGKKETSIEAVENWEAWRDRGRQVREHTIAHLDFYLDQFTRQAEAKGTRVHFAEDAGEAVRIFLKIVRDRNAKRVAKSKSMVSEEIRLNQHLEAAGVECVETDLGEWIIQLAGETPSHLIIPAIHKTRAQIQALFERRGRCSLTPDTAVLAGFARKTLREVFIHADIGMTGCNFAIAEAGAVVVFTNEGNGRMVATLPKTHVVMMGMERIIPTLADLEVMAHLLPRSATGQKITSYVQVLAGPRQSGEGDGPEEMHVIVLDNGRSRILGDPEFREVLHCIRCGACLNVCPVYRQVGGCAYDSVYSGPIGAVLTPLLQPETSYELSDASSLCGACAEACPVRIPLHDMLVRLRRRNTEAGRTPWSERLAFKLFASVFSRPAAYRLAGILGRTAQRLTVGEAARRTWADRFTGPMREWTRHRALPKPSREAFRDLWKQLARESDRSSQSTEPDTGGNR